MVEPWLTYWHNPWSTEDIIHSFELLVYLSMLEQSILEVGFAHSPLQKVIEVMHVATLWGDGQALVVQSAHSIVVANGVLGVVIRVIWRAVSEVVLRKH